MSLWRLFSWECTLIRYPLKKEVVGLKTPLVSALSGDFWVSSEGFLCQEDAKRDFLL